MAVALAGTLAVAAAPCLADPIVSWPNLKRTFVGHFATITPGAACAPETSVGVDRTDACAYVCTGAVWALIACPTGAGSGSDNYSEDFSGQTTVVLSHGLGGRNLHLACYNGSEQLVEPNTVTIGGAPNYDVTVTFFVAQTGRCVVDGG